MTVDYFDAWTQAVSPHIAPPESEAGWEVFLPLNAHANPGATPSELRAIWRAFRNDVRASYAAAESRARSTDPLRVLAQAYVDALARWHEDFRSSELALATSQAHVALDNYIRAMARSPK